jgi:GSH-dependent disulfide-bond oxidoreductase
MIRFHFHPPPKRALSCQLLPGSMTAPGEFLEITKMDSNGYTPPKVWTWDKASGVQFASNRPTAGATHEKVLPVGKHPLQLYSLATPNGQKVTIMLEELLALGHEGAEYDAWLIRILDGDQFGSGFVEVNPNSKIPALLDRSGTKPIRVFESGSIVLYLAQKFDALLPRDAAARTEAMNWLFWQMGSAPYVGGGFGHFYAYATTKIPYAIDRFTMEVKRQLDVLERRLSESPYLAGDEYSIADIAVLPWYGGLLKGWLYDAAEFLSAQDYPHMQRWADAILARPAVQRGRMVNRLSGPLSQQLRERHDASDFESRTQDKFEPPAA